MQPKNDSCSVLVLTLTYFVAVVFAFFIILASARYGLINLHDVQFLCTKPLLWFLGMVLLLPNLGQLLLRIKAAEFAGNKWEFFPQKLDNVSRVTTQSPSFSVALIEKTQEKSPADSASSAASTEERQNESNNQPEDPLSLGGWESIYARQRNIFLAHIIKPSRQAGQKYDLFIYLVGEQTEPNDLKDVVKAYFYLGPEWSTDPFPAKPDINGVVGIRTSAYGEILCTCRVHFETGEPVYLQRWIDFEMGWVFEGTPTIAMKS